MHTRPLQMGIASLWRELAWDVKYNNNKKNLPTFICLRLFFFLFSSFFCAPTAFQFEQNTKVTADICSKGGAAGVYVYSKLRRHVYLSTTRGNLVCAFHRTAVSASALSEEWRLVIVPLKTHIHAQHFFKTNFIFEVCFDFTVLASY